MTDESMRPSVSSKRTKLSVKVSPGLTGDVVCSQSEAPLPWFDNPLCKR